MADFNKERVILLTEYFLTNGKPVTVKELQDMYFNYCGVHSCRGTIDNDLESINMVVPLEGKLKDDNRRHVTAFTDTFTYGKETKVILQISEVEP